MIPEAISKALRKHEAETGAEAVEGMAMCEAVYVHGAGFSEGPEGQPMICFVINNHRFVTEPTHAAQMLVDFAEVVQKLGVEIEAGK